MSKLVPASTEYDRHWSVYINDNNKIDNEQIERVLLMEIRDELKKLNSVFSCYNFQSIPKELRGLRRDIKGKKR